MVCAHITCTESHTHTRSDTTAASEGHSGFPEEDTFPPHMLRTRAYSSGPLSRTGFTPPTTLQSSHLHRQLNVERSRREALESEVREMKEAHAEAKRQQEMEVERAKQVRASVRVCICVCE
jgi:hypothetical protein